MSVLNTGIKVGSTVARVAWDAYNRAIDSEGNVMNHPQTNVPITKPDIKQIKADPNRVNMLTGEFKDNAPPNTVQKTVNKIQERKAEEILAQANAPKSGQSFGTQVLNEVTGEPQVPKWKKLLGGLMGAVGAGLSGNEFDPFVYLNPDQDRTSKVYGDSTLYGEGVDPATNNSPNNDYPVESGEKAQSFRDKFKEQRDLGEAVFTWAASDGIERDYSTRLENESDEEWNTFLANTKKSIEDTASKALEPNPNEGVSPTTNPSNFPDSDNDGIPEYIDSDTNSAETAVAQFKPNFVALQKLGINEEQYNNLAGFRDKGDLEGFQTGLGEIIGPENIAGILESKTATAELSSQLGISPTDLSNLLFKEHNNYMVDYITDQKGKILELTQDDLETAKASGTKDYVAGKGVQSGSSYHHAQYRPW